MSSIKLSVRVCRAFPLTLGVTLAQIAAASGPLDQLTLPHANHPPVEVVAVPAPGTGAFVAGLYAVLAELSRDRDGPGLLLAQVGPDPATAALLARDHAGPGLIRVVRTLSASGAFWAQDYGEFAEDAGGPLVLATHGQAAPRGLADALARANGFPLVAWPVETGAAANGGGNVEALPDGIALVGSTAGPQLRAGLEAAYGTALVTIDTGWLDVGHVDEIVSSVLAPGTACGFTLVRASPAAALEILAAPGAADDRALPRYRRRALRAALDGVSTAGQWQQVLEQRLAAVADAIVARVATLDARCPALPVIALPVLYECAGDAQAPRRCRPIASNPVNLVVLGHTVLTGATRVPALDRAVTARLAAAGQRVRLLDDRFYRDLGGGVHCALNVRRALDRRVDPAIAEVSRAWPGSPRSGP